MAHLVKECKASLPSPEPHIFHIPSNTNITVQKLQINPGHKVCGRAQKETSASTGNSLETRAVQVISTFAATAEVSVYVQKKPSKKLIRSTMHEIHRDTDCLNESLMDDSGLFNLMPLLSPP